MTIPTSTTPLASARALVTEPLSGPAWLVRGYRLLLLPGVRGFMLIPLLGNVLLFSFAAFGAIYGLDAAFDRWLPDTVDWLRWLLYPLAGILLLVVAFFTATLLGNLLMAPFNGLLADRVERALTGTSPAQSSGESWRASVKRGLGDELRRLGYIVARVLAVFLLGMIPFIGVIAVPLGLLLGAWLLALEFAGNPLGNWGWDFARQRQYLRQRPGRFLAFGFAAMGAAFLPLLNFALIPAAIAGMTAMCLDLRRSEAALALAGSEASAPPPPLPDA
jgi:CysZ protein